MLPQWQYPLESVVGTERFTAERQKMLVEKCFLNVFNSKGKNKEFYFDSSPRIRLQQFHCYVQFFFFSFIEALKDVTEV